ncbi:MAG: FecR family protein [Reichenbachiella sp.]
MKEEEYIKKWLSDSLNEEERKQFEQTEDFEFVEKISGALLTYKSPEIDQKALFKQLKERISTSKVVPIYSTIAFRIAASIVLVIGFAYLFFQINALDEPLIAKVNREMVLPDQSKVILNAQSNLSYEKSDWSNDRKAFLKGEAYFEVTKGSRFEIESSAGTVSVLGTAFNIKDREDYFEVKCFHGSVKVETALGERILIKNQSLRMVDGTIEMIQSGLGSQPSWLDGKSAFESVAYKQVLSELERQYGIAIINQGVNTERLFTGKFTHSNLNLALESITKPLNITFKVDDRQVTLLSDI